MRLMKLDDMIGGWLIGDFEPSVFHTSDFELGIKKFLPGDIEAPHLHKISAEVTVIISGEVLMAGHLLRSGDIIHLEPGEVSDFKALEETLLVAIKIPSAPGDKYETKKDEDQR